MASECPPILSKHPMLKTLEELSRDPVARRKVIEGIAAGGDAGERLTRIEADGLMSRYRSDGAQTKARQQLLDGAWGDGARLLRLSDTVRKAFEAVEATRKPLVAWWAPGTTRQDVAALCHEGAEAIYLIVLSRALDANAVMSKAYDPELLHDLRAQASALFEFFERL